MAVLKMKRIEIVSAIEDSSSLTDFIQRSGKIELSDFEENGELRRISAAASVSQFDKYLTVVKSAEKVLDKYCPQKKSLLASFDGAREISASDYIKKSDEADGILSECMKINSLAKKIDESKASIIRLQTLADALVPWLGLDVPMKYGGTKTTTAFIGSFQKEYTLETLLSGIASEDSSLDGISAEIISSSQDLTCVFILCPKDIEKPVEQALRGLGFIRPSDPTKHPARVRYDRYMKQIDDCRKVISESEEKIRKSCGMHGNIEFVTDYLTVRRGKYEALGKIAVDDRLMALTGYVPEKYADKLAERIEKRFTAAVSISEPEPEEDTPVLFGNNRFGAAVESVTEMYSLPGKEDVDPNPVMAFFYYALFGIMLSDAGYGVIMVIAMLVAKTKMKLSEKMKKTTDMFMFCGISTVFWGTLFGSWFGDIVPVVSEQFFGRKIDSLALWFEPVDDPMKMLLYSFLFGIIHLFVGLGVKFYMLWKSGQRFAAFCDVIPVYLLVAGIAPIGAGVITDISPTASAIGKYLAIAGAVLIILTSGRSSKNIFGKLGGGLYGLYNIGAGYLGDILSYSRLLALGLSTGVIASVINILGTMPSNKAVKAIMLVIVFILGHTVNIAINLIGTYVHTNRLQYVEFFSKFYEGGGRAFTPLKANTKYYSIRED